ncbi:hypothetical protein C8R47DRAFT_1217761 [Mycena vitilis]|nr:hypothetical protein C8R47DRAFT_1217761 [Mycena vitilis]
MPLLPRSELLQRGAEYAKREAPRIGGSTAGFIGLVVGLGVIILLSCVAIYILLRDHSPSQRERAARRHDSRYPADSSRAPQLAAGPIPWSEKLGGLFTRGRPSKRASKSGHGWIQASGDAWEADEADRSREMAGLDAPFRPPTDPYAASYSSDSIAATYDQPETRYTPTPMSISIPRSMSPESSGVHPIGTATANDSRQFSVESAGSVRTFEGGTKFIEGL